MLRGDVLSGKLWLLFVLLHLLEDEIDEGANKQGVIPYKLLGLGSRKSCCPCVCFATWDLGLLHRE